MNSLFNKRHETQKFLVSHKGKCSHSASICNETSNEGNVDDDVYQNKINYIWCCTIQTGGKYGS